MLRRWWRTVVDEVRPDIAEAFTHTAQLVIAISLEVLLSSLLHLPFVPAALRERVEPILIFAIEATLVIFCARSLTIFAINAGRAARRRLRYANLGGSALVLVAALGIVLAYVGTNRSPLVATFSLDRATLRSANASNQFWLPQDVKRVRLRFFLPIRANCRYVGLLDRDSRADLLTHDSYGNFVYEVSADRMRPGQHELEVLEFPSIAVADRTPPYVFVFEVVRE